MIDQGKSVQCFIWAKFLIITEKLLHLKIVYKCVNIRRIVKFKKIKKKCGMTFQTFAANTNIFALRGMPMYKVYLPTTSFRYLHGCRAKKRVNRKGHYVQAPLLTE